MNDKKNVIIAVLATVCLMSTMFAFKVYGARWPYNPLWDITDDGKIDIQDLARISGSFGTTGTPINKTAWFDLSSRVDQLTASLNELNASVNQLNATANELNGTVNELNTSVNELNVSLNEVQRKLNFIYHVTVAAMQSLIGNNMSVPIEMDGVPTGFNTPHLFHLMGSHIFTVPAITPEGHAFKFWVTGSSDPSINISSTGKYTAFYEPIDHPGNSMWIEPDQIVLPNPTTSAFNVTVWLNTSDLANAWQLYLVYNKNHLIATRTGYTGIGKSLWSGSLPVDTVTPMFGTYNSTHNYVLYGEILKNIAVIARSGSLCWVEFDVVQLLPPGQTWTGTVRLDLIGVFKSEVYDIDLNLLPVNYYHSIYWIA